MDSDTFERTIAEYLTNLRDAHGWETAYVLSDRTRKYYTPEGFSKIVDEAKDPYDSVAGTGGHLVDYRKNSEAMKEFLFAEE